MNNPLDQAPPIPPELLAQLAGTQGQQGGPPSDMLEAAKTAEMALSRLASLSPDLSGLVNEFVRAMRARIVPALSGQGGAAPPTYTQGINNATI